MGLLSLELTKASEQSAGAFGSEAVRVNLRALRRTQSGVDSYDRVAVQERPGNSSTVAPDSADMGDLEYGSYHSSLSADCLTQRTWSLRSGDRHKTGCAALIHFAWTHGAFAYVSLAGLLAGRGRPGRAILQLRRRSAEDNSAVCMGAFVLTGTGKSNGESRLPPKSRRAQQASRSR